MAQPEAPAAQGGGSGARSESAQLTTNKDHFSLQQVMRERATNTRQQSEPKGHAGHFSGLDYEARSIYIDINKEAGENWYEGPSRSPWTQVRPLVLPPGR